ncbi:MAG: hypothetical protein ACRD4O_00365 [Bryobacteraceae bacterium]
MDTREKIVALDRLPALFAGAEWTVIAGFFDPMTAAQAKRIARYREDGRKLLAVVLEDGETLLPADARAVLAAALRAVDAVAVARPGEWQSAIPKNVKAACEDIYAERARTAEFVQFILDRKSPAPLSGAAR